MRIRDMSAITDGTAQDQRLSPALEDHYFDVDPRSFEEVVARNAELSKHISYFNLKNQAESTWSELFSSNEAVIMAEILAIDTARMEADFLPLLKDPAFAASYLADFSLRINSWYQQLRRTDSDAAQSLSRYIGQVIQQKLTTALRHTVLYVPRSRSAEFDSISAFDPLWGLVSGQPMRRSIHPATIEKRLRLAFYLLTAALTTLKPVAATYFKKSLSSGNHDPSIALFLAFVGLLQKVQNKLNTFSARHRDFYYLDVLRMTPKGQIPDCTILLFKTDITTASLLIPAGTAFTAGKVGGKTDLIYLADNSLKITNAQVCRLMTLYCQRDPKISPEFELGYISGLRLSNVFSEAAIVPGVLPPSRPLFGAQKPSAVTGVSENAMVGFAVASSTLQLRESSRTISATVSFKIPAASDSPLADDGKPQQSFADRFRRLIFGHLRATADEKKEFSDAARALNFSGNDLLAQGDDPEYIFNSVMSACFRPSVTTSAGWYEIQQVKVSMKNGDVALTLRLNFQMTLTPDAPAIRPYNAAIHGAGFDTTLPVLRFCLDLQGAIYGYSLFSDLIVEEILIESTVSDATRIVAWNQFGQLDTSKPFLPFGPLPTKSSYLVVGNFDSALMNLTELKVNLEWGNLPGTPYGLGEYYRDYGPGYDNDQFLGRLSVLRDGRWRTQDSSGTRLFNSNRHEGVEPDRTINMDVVSWFDPIDPTITEEKFRFDQATRSGFFRIELVVPEMAFGHSEYPHLLTTILTENAHSSIFKRKPRALPPPPYTPSLQRISFTYSAASLIVAVAPGEAKASTEKAFLIHPLGIETVTTNNPWTFLPVFDHDGNLYIGFSATDPTGPLTLFFHLREDSSKILPKPQKLTWSYLVSDRWFALKQNEVLSDTTDGFLTSGIVTLDIPSGIRRNNSIADGNLYWVRLSADTDLDSFCSLYSVHAQAATVTRSLTPQAPSVLRSPLPVGSIKAPVVSIPGLRSVTQLIESSGGRESETPLQQRTRTAERLRHKARAITPWDYERLILDEFPEVFKVKCFPAMSSESGLTPSPGSVLIVVIPRMPDSVTPPVFDPMLNAISLKRIRDFAQAHSSAQVTVEVRNPVYERILVRCVVRFQPSAMQQQGYFLNQLNQAVIDYISPWSKEGIAPRFGWSLQLDEIEAFIRRQYYVEFLTGLSVLRLTQDPIIQNQVESYQLDDTAPAQRNKDGDAPTQPSVRTLYPRFPWSIAIPDAGNIIVLSDSDTYREMTPQKTGVGELVLGKTFVVMKGQDHGNN